MEKALSPNQFLFEEIVLQILKQGKKQIKTGIFQTIQPEDLIKQSNGSLQLDLYHHYFLACMSSIRLKQLACTRYQKIVREGLFDRQHVPIQIISSILNACSSGGGSTTGSSMGSANISTNNHQNQSLYVVNLIKSILIKIPQPLSEMQLALTYILQGTRNKKFALFYNSIMEQVYLNTLCKMRQSPLQKLLKMEMNHILNEVEQHLPQQKFKWKINDLDEFGKKIMCIHEIKNGNGKFGKCYYCGKQADNYCKDQYVPLCSFQCKFKVKQVIQRQKSEQNFSLLTWLLQNLISGDQIIYSILGRQIAHQRLSLQHIKTILNTIIQVFTACSNEKIAMNSVSSNQNNQIQTQTFKQVQKHSLNIFLHILLNYRDYYQRELSDYFKVFFFEIVKILELIPIKRFKEKSQLNKSKGQISSKQSLQSSNPDFSIDNMTSLHHMSQQNQIYSFQQQFSNPFLNSLIQILSNQDLFFHIYTNYDCKFFQPNLLAKMMNIISQYAKEQIISKQSGLGVTGSSAYGVFSILKMLTERLANYQKHKNLKTFRLQQQNKLIQIFLQKYPVSSIQMQKKKKLPKIIQIFNKKPKKGIEALKKLFSINLQSSSSNIESNEQLKQQKIKEVLKKVQEVQKIQQLNQEQKVEQIYSKVQKLEKNQNQNLEKSLNQQQHQKMQNNPDQNNKQQLKINDQANKQQTAREKIKQNLTQTQKIVTKPQGENQKLKQKLTQISKEESTKKKKVQQIINTDITPRQIAILIRQNLDYEAKLKKIILFNKQSVGQYFGSNDPYAGSVCFEFFQLIPFQGLQIDDCMRLAFNFFGLPKQAQQLQRVLDEFTKSLLPYTKFQNSLNIYQYVYALMMVQSGHNPNVRQNDKIKMPLFVSMVGHIVQAKEWAQKDYKRIKQNSLNNLMRWGSQIFKNKYIMKVNQQILFNKQLENPEKKSIINIKHLMQYLWQYVYISIVNNQKKNSTMGVFEAIVLYGKYDLIGEQVGFMQIFKRSYEHNKAKQSLEALLRLAIQFNHYLYEWNYLITLSYHLEESNIYYQSIDKIFTNLQFINKEKLKIFLQTICEFSSSQYKNDKQYNRELFVLRHITQILQYNLTRLQLIWTSIWPIIQKYFKGICMHPRKQISMSAIDSYKQLSLKIFKIKQSSTSAVNHSEVLQTYLYIFQRSNIFLKDLIINILLNVVSSDISSGWEIIYEILNITDSQDKSVVMKVIDRLVKQVGYKKLTSLHKLHSILIKQLRININTPTLIQSILNRLWQISQIIDERAVWIQSMRSIKDIYKMSLNNKLLILFFRICNKFLSPEIINQDEKKKKEPIQQLQYLKSQDQDLDRQNNIQQGQNIVRNQQVLISKELIPITIDRQLYNEIVDLLIFLMDNNQKSNKKYTITLKQALECFSQLSIRYVVRYLVGVSGFLNIFTMYVNSDHKLVFLMFFKKYLQAKIFDELIRQKNHFVLIETMNWVNLHFKQSLPSDLLAMTSLDEDFKRDRTQISMNESISAQNLKLDLIQFSLSQKQFNVKSIANLILLDCISILIDKNAIERYQMQQKQMENSVQKLYDSLIQNYKTAQQTNRLIVLRNFLFNNSFLFYHTYVADANIGESSSKDKNSTDNRLIQPNKEEVLKKLPGLHKHEKRTLFTIIQNLPFKFTYDYSVQTLRNFIQVYTCKYQFQDNSNNKRRIHQSKSRKNSQYIRVSLENQRKHTESNAKKDQNLSQKKQQILKVNTKKESNQKKNVKQNKNIQEDKFINQKATRQLYLTDLNNWLQTMQKNLRASLNILKTICKQQIKEKKIRKEKILDQKKIEQLFNLCLGLCEEDGPLWMVRQCSEIMQILLQKVMQGRCQTNV